jgi:hypothetical protein
MNDARPDIVTQRECRLDRDNVVELGIGHRAHLDAVLVVGVQHAIGPAPEGRVVGS